MQGLTETSEFNILQLKKILMRGSDSMELTAALRRRSDAYIFFEEALFGRIVDVEYWLDVESVRLCHLS